MPEENQEVQNQETETPELENLDVSLLETPGEIEESETVEIDGEQVSRSDVIDAYKNKSNWQKSNTQRAQEIAEQRRQLDQQQAKIKEQEERLAAFEQGLYRNYYPTNQPNQPNPNWPGQIPAYPGQSSTNPTGQTQSQEQPVNYDDLDLDDPAIKAILQRLDKQEQRWQNWEERYKQEQFLAQKESEHQRLKNMFGDYDPLRIEKAIMAGRNPFEDTYKATSFDAIRQGDETAILKLIPNILLERIKTEAQTELKTKLLNEAKKREQLRKKMGTPSPSGDGLPKIPPPATIPKDYTEVRKLVKEFINEEGIKLIE